MDEEDDESFLADDFDGVVRYFNKHGKLHHKKRPALDYSNVFGGGPEYWFLDGKKHRLDGPAVIHQDGRHEWWLDGKRHRIDGPAVEYTKQNIKPIIGPVKNLWWYKGERIECDNLEDFQRLIKLKVFW